jgi:hypothetical protein
MAPRIGFEPLSDRVLNIRRNTLNMSRQKSAVPPSFRQREPRMAVEAACSVRDVPLDVVTCQVRPNEHPWFARWLHIVHITFERCHIIPVGEFGRPTFLKVVRVVNPAVNEYKLRLIKKICNPTGFLSVLSHSSVRQQCSLCQRLKAFRFEGFLVKMRCFHLNFC